MHRAGLGRGKLTHAANVASTGSATAAVTISLNFVALAGRALLNTAVNRLPTPVPLELSKLPQL